MSEAIGDLSGVSLLAPEFGKPDHISILMMALRPGYLDMELAESDIIETAKNLGATIVKDRSGDPELHRQHLSQAGAFTLRSSKPLFDEKMVEIDRLQSLAIKRPNRWSYAAWKAQADTSLPVILASDLDGGVAKYLIEDWQQIYKFDSLNQYYYDQPIEDMFEVREFIPTPSEHYTSYRVLTSAKGDIMAAGLLYSDHTAEQGKTISIKPSNTFGLTGSIKHAALEDPGTAYFMNALDVRSNLNQGGHCIPLMGGPKARAITTKEAGILEAHAIAPFDIQIPKKLEQAASQIATILGNVPGLVTGIDFLLHAETGDLYFLEANAGPGARTFIECWMGGDQDISPADAHRALLGCSLASIAMSENISNR